MRLDLEGEGRETECGVDESVGEKERGRGLVI